MAVLFFVIGLELGRYVIEGQLSEPKEVILPALGTIEGMIVPAVIYFWINRRTEIASQGWTIPAATDIAFAPTILALLATRGAAHIENIPGIDSNIRRCRGDGYHCALF